MNVTSFSHLNQLGQTMRLFWRAASGLLLLLAATVSAAAATIVVNSTDENNGFGCPSVKCTLRDAISTAESNGVSDDIVLQNGATYLLTTAFVSNNGLPKITTQVRIIGNGAIIWRAANSQFFRFFTIDPGGDLTLENLTLRGGQPNDHGGAIFNSGKLAVINSVIDNNKGGNMGGAIYNDYGSVRIEKSTLRYNTAQHGGGLNSTGGDGDSVSLNKFGQVTIVNSSIVRNRATAGWGGGIRLGGAHNVDIKDSTISHNWAKQDGGGVMFATLAKADAQGNPFVVSLRNVTISNNTALLSAGGLCYSICGMASCPDPTIPVIANTILANNQAAKFKDYTVNVLNMLKSGGSNIIGAGNVGFDLSGATGDQLLGAAPLPNLGSLTDTGDAGGEHVRPLAGCSAIDGVLAGFSSTVDQLGLARVGKADIGAIEFRRCVGPPPGMSAWWGWPLTSSNTLIDSAGATDNQGFALNPPTAVAGMVDSAICFDGADRTVRVPNHFEVDFLGNAPADCGSQPLDFAIDAWVKTSATGVQVILDKRDVGNNFLRGYSLFLYNGRLGFQMATGTGNGNCGAPGSACTNYVSPAPALAGVDLSDNRWHLIAVTVERCLNPVGRFYIDGKQVATFAPRPGDLSNNADLLIGSSYATAVSSATHFTGCVDEIEIFKRALNAKEVAGLYYAGWAGKCGKKAPPPSDGCNPSCQ